MTDKALQRTREGHANERLHYVQGLKENYFMVTMNAATRARLLFIGEFLLVFIFAVSFRQLPLYSSNQNTYFVHGLANAWTGYLGMDWLARTADPFPLFSGLVSITTGVFGENAFYLYQVIIQFFYAYSILRIGSHVLKFDIMGMKYLCYFALLVALYSGVLARSLSALPGLWHFAFLFNPDGLLASGVAGQYILGPVFQPSVFGVFILFSMYAFLRDRSLAAVVFLSIAAVLHATYLLSAAVLASTYMAIIVFQDKDYRKALMTGTTALVLVMPVLAYSYLNFAPASADSSALAQSILVDYRIPHHASVANWFGMSTLFQIVIVAWSLYVVRRTKLFPVLLMPFLAAVILAAIQVLTGSKSLALLFPWRISVFLVPIASSVILAGTVSVIFQMYRRFISHFQFTQKPVRLAFLVGGIAIVVLSLVPDFTGIGDQPGFGTKQSLGLVAGFGLLGAGLAVPRWPEAPCFLNQVRIVNVLKAAIICAIVIICYPGVRNTLALQDAPRTGVNASTRFVAETYKPGSLYLIPPDMESFRLAARIPILVDFKSHPYKDTEVIEWFHRVEAAKAFYASTGDRACGMLRSMSGRYGITHVVFKKESSIGSCPVLHETYRDAGFHIYEVQGPR